MTDAQQINQDDHAFSKFTKFDDVYLNQLVDPSQVTSSVAGGLGSDKTVESPKGSPITSPSLPKRPTSPAKPPRKAEKLKKSISNIESSTKTAPFPLTHSSSFSKIPQAARPSVYPKPTLYGTTNSSSTSIPLSSTVQKPSSPTLASRPSLATKPVKAHSFTDKKQSSFSEKHQAPLTSSTASTKVVQQTENCSAPSRPPVPARPPHTLGIASTDVKPSTLIIASTS